MGFGDFGSNRSVHWRQFIGDGTGAKPAGTGVDPKDHGQIGRGKAPKQDHPDRFRVTARFPDNDSARTALNQALIDLGNGTEVRLDVPVRDIRDDPWDPAEVTVDW